MTKLIEYSHAIRQELRHAVPYDNSNIGNRVKVVLVQARIDSIVEDRIAKPEHSHSELPFPKEFRSTCKGLDIGCRIRTSPYPSVKVYTSGTSISTVSGRTQTSFGPSPLTLTAEPTFRELPNKNETQSVYEDLVS